MRRLFAFTLLAALGSAAEPARPPNILFLFADDQRHDTLGAAGHPIVRTPALDRLAADGVRFRNAFVTTSVCWVSRAVVLTGQWARSHLRRDSVPTVRSEALATMFPALLRSAGYQTLTPIVVTNSAAFTAVEVLASGQVAAGDPVLQVRTQ